MLDLTKVPRMADITGWLSDVEHGCLQNLAARVAHPGCVFVEVGSYLGRSTQALARVVSLVPGGLVYSVDNWVFAGGHPCGINHLSGFCDNMKAIGLRDRVAIMYMDSLQAAAIFRDASADLVFIDASHRYPDVKADIAAWLPKVKPGGLFVGHDVEERWSHPNVQAAVPLNTEDSDMTCVQDENAPIRSSSHLPFCCHVNVIRAVTEAFGEDYERELSGNTIWWKEIHG